MRKKMEDHIVTGNGRPIDEQCQFCYDNRRSHGRGRVKANCLPAPDPWEIACICGPDCFCRDPDCIWSNSKRGRIPIRKIKGD